MDNKRMLIAMALVMALVLGWQTFVSKYYMPRHPEFNWNGTLDHSAPETPASAPQLTTAPSFTSSGGPIATTMASTTEPSSRGSALYHASGLGQTGVISLGSDQEKNPDYSLGMQLSSVGAGIDDVTLNQYKAHKDPKDIYTFLQPYEDRDGTRSLATHNIIVNGYSVDVSGDAWTLESSDNKSTATYGIYIDNETGQHVLHVSVTYLVSKQGPESNRKNTAAGYEVGMTYHVENLAAQAQDVRIVFNGPTMPPVEVERGADRVVISGYDKSNKTVDLVHHAIEEFKTTADNKSLIREEKNDYKFLWAGTASNYFSAIVLPDPLGTLDQVDARLVNPAAAQQEQHEVALSFATASQNIGRGAAVNIPFKIFIGPKSRELLEGNYYYDFPRRYDQTLVMSGGMCGLSFCASAQLVDWLIDLLHGFHWICRDWGLSIILLVMLVRGILHPITKHSQVSMMKAQKMGPEMERLKKKFGDDKEGYAKAQMQVYKEVGFTPILGCLPMFLQMPIWIALYAALQSDINLRQAPFLWGFTWIHDLASPDKLYVFKNVVSIFGYKLYAFNLMPVLMAVVYFMQQKYMPKPPAATPEQAKQQKMMQWMSLLFPVFLYNYPSGLNLYIFTSSAIGIIESRSIRKHIKRKQDAEKSDQVIIDAKPTRAGKENRKEEKKERAQGKQPEKPGAVGGLWARMQRKVEELREQAERANNNKNKKN